MGRSPLLRKIVPIMQLEFTVPNMTSDESIKTITNALMDADPNAIVMIDPTTRQVSVDTVKDANTIKKAIVGAGYTLR
jgi:copper chaperone CopZ